MAEITRKRTGELLRGVFRILYDKPDGLPAKTILQQLESVVPPTDFESSSYERNPHLRRYEKIVRFSTITTVKAGWLQKDKGLWILTDAGRRAFDQFADPKQFQIECSRLYRQWAAQRPEEKEQEFGEEEIDVEPSNSSTTLEEAEETSWAEVEAHFRSMSPYDFQNLVAGLLKGMGYHVGWVAPPGPDRGIDVIAHADPLGVSGPRIKVQVKRTADRIAVREIRSFMALLSDGDIGLYVAMGGFTKDAEEEARYQEKRRIMLLDLRKIFDLWVEHYNRIPEEERTLLQLTPVWFITPRTTI